MCLNEDFIEMPSKAEQSQDKAKGNNDLPPTWRRGAGHESGKESEYQSSAATMSLHTILPAHYIFNL